MTTVALGNGRKRRQGGSGRRRSGSDRKCEGLNRKLWPPCGKKFQGRYGRRSKAGLTVPRHERLKPHNYEFLFSIIITYTMLHKMC
jgi:hypothetical protein